MRKLLNISIMLLIILSSISFQNNHQTQAKNIIQQDPPSISYLMADTITYFSVPENGNLAITFHHNYYDGNANFKIFNQKGDLYDEIIFHHSESDETKNVNFLDAGTYKMVACGTRFSYSMDFSGPAFDWKFVMLGLPHKGIFRVKEEETATMYFKVNKPQFTFYVNHELAPFQNRRGTIKLYDASDNLRSTFTLGCTNLNECFEQKQDFQRENNDEEFWYATITGETSSQARIGIWIDDNTFQYPTGRCLLLTISEEYYFIPEFENQDVSIQINKETDHKAKIGAASYPGFEYEELYTAYTKDLNLGTFNHYVSWRWRERASNGNSENDDSDPFHINWDGFDFSSTEQRFSSFFHELNISPIVNIQWSSDCFISQHPALWDENQMDEYAELCLAMVIFLVAPDIIDPATEREPYLISAIHFFAEPNLLFNGHLERDDAIDQYIQILQKVGERIKSYPDERIQQTKICVSGVGGDSFGEEQKEYWISRILESAEEYTDIVSWDMYFKWCLEEVEGYGKDVEKIQTILDEKGYDKEIAMPEFNLRGGVPTSHYFFGSNYSALFLFGAISQSINKGMDEIVYFSLVDSNYEPRCKGLITSDVSMPPYSTLPPFTKKPQYHAMQIIGEICKGNILEISSESSQIDILASKENEIIRMGISNRYEASTNISIPIAQGTPVIIYSVENNGLQCIEQTISPGLIDFDIPAWKIYYLICGNQASDSSADITCKGSLQWSNVGPETEVSGQFSVSNTGHIDSYLEWAIIEWPEWGIWSFQPNSGVDLTPIDGEVYVDVTINAPDKTNKDFTGYIIIANVDDANDIDMIPVTLSTTKSKHIQMYGLLQNLFEKSISWHNFIKDMLLLFN